jgi:hypothetical protein
MVEMKPVILESPYAGDRATNIRYAQRAMLDALARGEAPFASHLLYTSFLDDDDPVQRKLGMEAGLAWGQRADACVVYTDYGISPGMSVGIERAELAGIPIEYREIGVVI